MRRKRKRTQIAWDVVFGLLLAVNIAVGLYASRLTSMILIRVEGAAPEDQPRISALLQRLHSQPALQLNKRQTESRMLEKSSIETAEMTRNIFGRARLKLTQRTPVAMIAGLPGAAIDRHGVVFQTRTYPSDLPIVRIPDSARHPIVALAGRWRAGKTGELASKIVGLAKDLPTAIIASEDGGLCLNIGSKFSVELGLPEQLDEKVGYLRKQIEDDPALLASEKTLILVSLDRPSYRLGVVRSK